MCDRSDCPQPGKVLDPDLAHLVVRNIAFFEARDTGQIGKSRSTTKRYHKECATYLGIALPVDVE